MHRVRWWVLPISVFLQSAARAGMPSPLPTPFTADKFPHTERLDPWIDQRLQALSFFLMALFAVTFLVHRGWRLLRRDWPALPELSFRGACLAVGLWGLASIVVLTMISGARELMTPGAWKKQGWTYQLSTVPPSDAGGRESRRSRMEAMRTALLLYAATHAGSYPERIDQLKTDITIPEHPGFELLYRPGVTADRSPPEIVVFEPELGDPERFVLYSNGLLGTMRTPELTAALATKPAETVP